MTPLLSELREGNMVNNLEDLTRSASDAAADIHRLQNEVQAGSYRTLMYVSSGAIGLLHAMQSQRYISTFVSA